MKYLKKYYHLIMATWLLVIIVVMSFMSSWHNLNFAEKKITNRANKFDKQAYYQLVHFLGGECQCSEYVVEYLVRRRPTPNTFEKVVIYEDRKNFKSKLEASGYRVELQTYEDLEKEDSPSGIPLLVIANPSGGVLYEGGYSNKLINPFTEFQDLVKLEEVKKIKREIASMPAYGCAVSEKYKKWIDPLSLKYGEVR
ncbi:hypothetical protein M900_2559 [Bacteriovorax sp. Seq25_V]|nr:hypothetical protein M900_2559 [Bacteriovorax sp. Seq25_V]